jgi:chitinase
MPPSTAAATLRRSPYVAAGKVRDRGVRDMMVSSAGPERGELRRIPHLRTGIFQRLVLPSSILIISLTAAAFPLKHHTHTSSGPQIIAYVFSQDRLLSPGEIAAGKLTRINYAFALIHDGRIVTESPDDAANLAALAALRQDNPSLQVLISVGGWLGSGNFSDMAASRESRAQFIDSVIAFLAQYRLDGLDIDWEFPAQAGAGNRFRPEDKRNYTLLLMELRQRFKREQRKLGRRLLLSVAAGASQSFLDHTEMGRVAHSVDTVNLMAYDYYEPGSEKITGNHAPLYTDPSDPKQISADTSIREFEDAGVPAHKIVLGVPFYGHVWGNVAATNHGLFQPGSRVPNAYARYHDIVANMLDHGYTRYWDTFASVPYLYNAEKSQFVSYEDPESLALKCAYVQRHHLGGIMFWEYSGDASGALLDTIHRAFYGSKAMSEGGQ